MNIVAYSYLTSLHCPSCTRLEHNADTLKLYGRNEAMLKLLTTPLATLQSSGSDFDAKKEGRWLVFDLFQLPPEVPMSFTQYIAMLNEHMQLRAQLLAALDEAIGEVGQEHVALALIDKVKAAA